MKETLPLPKRKLRRFALWLLGIALFLSVSYFGGLAIAGYQARRDLEEEVAALQALGVPVTASQMRLAATLKDNAAPLYLKAMEVFAAHGEPPTAASIYRPDPKTTAEVRKWVETHSDTLELVRRAAQMQNCAFERDWDQGMLMVLPEFPKMKWFIRLATLRARLDSEAGKYPEAVGWLDVGRKVASHMREPVDLAQQASMTGEVIVHSEFQRELDLYGNQSAFLREARSFDPERGALPSMIEALKSEVLWLRSAMKLFERDESGGMEILFGGAPSWTGADFWWRARFYSLRWSSVRMRVEAKALHHFRDLVEALHTSKESNKTLLTEGKRVGAAISSDTSWTGLVVRDLLPELGWIGPSIVRVKATRRLSRCGLELWSARASSGSFPTRLPNEPWAVDPFTGRPFVYRPAKDDFVLYSLGPNGRDDGGRMGSGGADDVRFDREGSAP